MPGEKVLDLYLDESGDFNDGKPGRNPKTEPSMVGGLLCDPSWLTQERRNTFFRGTKVHACSGYEKRFLEILRSVYTEGCRFVVFENTERIRIVDSNITYANIISEGLVHLFRDLVIEYPQGVQLNVVIAQRQLQLKEYTNRILEKIIMALGREAIPGIQYKLIISDARTDKRLFFADIICNTWMTQHRIKVSNTGLQSYKFTLEEQALIAKMYDKRWIYPVFEDATTKYVRQLMLEGHIGEAMNQICSLSKLVGFTALRNRVVADVEKADSYQQDAWFQQMSLMISQYNRQRLYKDGILFAQNYIRYFLETIRPEGHLERILPYWRFDTDYHILTMYDHLGNTKMCQEYLQKCQENITSVSRSWEHIDYYFSFCIRELNVLMGRFAFREVIRRAEELIGIFSEARDLFSMIRTYNGKEQEVRSELLGKTYGVYLEALINLLHEDPNLFDKALMISDKAIAEFDDERDICRQYQYRCLLLAEAGKSQEALTALLQACMADSPKDFLRKAYGMKSGSPDFLLWHYTNVMLLFQKEDNPLGKKMYRALTECLEFMVDLGKTEEKGHPWNLILWNMARYARAFGDQSKYKKLYREAMLITRANHDNVTMLTFALSISADRLLWCRENSAEDLSGAEMDLQSVYKGLSSAKLTDEMISAFDIRMLQDTRKATDQVLVKVANAYLK